MALRPGGSSVSSQVLFWCKEFISAFIVAIHLLDSIDWGAFVYVRTGSGGGRRAVTHDFNGSFGGQFRWVHGFEGGSVSDDLFYSIPLLFSSGSNSGRRRVNVGQLLHSIVENDVPGNIHLSCGRAPAA